MNRKIRSLMLLFGLLSASAFCQSEPLKLWYEKPANEWVEALPVGNGQMGGMVFGNVERELIQLNEGTLWSGGPQKKGINLDAQKHLKPLREALAKENYELAEQLCKKMQGNFSESFLPLGDLMITQDLANKRTTSYYRDLNLNEAIATTRFTIDGVNYVREIFTSAPDSVMVIHITASKEKMLNLKIQLASKLKNSITSNGNSQLLMSGKAPARLDPSYYKKEGRNSLEYQDLSGCNGMRFSTRLNVISTDGQWVTNDSLIQLNQATEVTILLAAATSFNGFDKCPDSEGKNEREITKQRIDRASVQSVAQLRATHIADFRNYFDRVSLTIGSKSTSPSNSKMSSDFRLKAYSYGGEDPELEALYFQYGRYLLISSSRLGGTAANLQGIWNKELRAPWSSNYTTNINVEMNYWPAEVCNLSEMHQPLLDWIGSLSKSGKVTAKEFYNTNGWVAHHNSDIWALSTPVGNLGGGSPSWANWYMGGNWLCLHLWEHYKFTGDRDYLRTKAYPVMKEAALFCFDWLIEKDGYLITSPSTSPENRFVVNGKDFSVTTASTMDMAIIRNLFTNLIEVSELLGVDVKFRKQLIAKREKLYPNQIGSQGQLQEWSKDFKEQDPNHRHVSHLFGLHPANQISPLTTPLFAKAAKKTLELRGDDGTGWSKAWKINFWARLLDGNHAHDLVRDILKYTDNTGGGVMGGGTYPNFFDAHPPFQIDGNFGATAGMAEMLLQSQLNELHLLPALPDAWDNGSVKGLKARGNFEVSITWKKGQITQAILKSERGEQCVIRTSIPITCKEVDVKSVLKEGYYITEFATKVAQVYTFSALK